MIDLASIARTAALASYSPYSGFRVGAAVVAKGNIYCGCNVENASYGLTICAERVAIFNAIAAGARGIDRIALACVDATLDSDLSVLMPCGACRQVMAEFAGPDLAVEVVGAGTFLLAELLPQAFTLTTRGET